MALMKILVSEVEVREYMDDWEVAIYFRPLSTAGVAQLAWDFAVRDWSEIGVMIRQELDKELLGGN